MRPASVALGTVVLGTVFIIGPAAMIAINQAVDWPRWQTAGGAVLGAGLMVLGIATALHCTGLFWRLGDGTPIPIEPPRHLVDSGMYAYSRNPMYVADMAILLGLFLHRGEVALLLYAGIMAVFFQGWLLWHEEPLLEARFGDAYREYVRRVPRWLAWR